MGITYKLEINITNKQQDILKSMKYDSDYKHPFILINYLIPENGTKVVLKCINDSVYMTNYEIKFFCKETLIKSINFDDSNLRIKTDFVIPENSTSLDFIIIGSLLKKDLKQNLPDLKNYSMGHPLFIYNAERFNNKNIDEKKHLKKNLYLKSTLLLENYLKEKNIISCGDVVHYFKCANAVGDICPGILYENEKLNYCNIYLCLYQCKFDLKNCVVNNFVKEIKTKNYFC